MPKCTKCGKKFQTLSALNDHYRSVHPNQKFVAPKTSTSRNLVLGLVVVIIVVGGLVGFLIYSSSTSHSQTTTTTGTTILGQPINDTLYSELTGVSTPTLASVGGGSATNSGLQTPNGSPLTLNGKPEFLYIGAEYCPYCAVERWAMAVALSKFGTMTGIGYMVSAPDDGNITTLTFANVNYSSNYIAFQAVETENRADQPFQTMTSAQSSVFSKYDSGGSIPFVDIDNQYVIVGAQYSINPQASNIFSNLNWSQIGSQLNDPSTSLAKAIDGSANYLISMICKIDGNQPSTVCGQSFSSLSFAILPPSAQIQAGGPFSVGIPVARTSKFVF